MFFDFLEAADGRPLVKHFTKRGDSIEFDPYPNVRDLNSLREEVPDIAPSAPSSSATPPQARLPRRRQLVLARAVARLGGRLRIRRGPAPPHLAAQPLFCLGDRSRLRLPGGRARLHARAAAPRGRLLVLWRAEGNLQDYSHTGMLLHPDAEHDHFPQILSWLAEG